jgi:Bacteriophage tail sheath protein
MPEYLAPGVYVEEIQSGPRPIEGVNTSVAGFVGQTERGPTVPTLVTSWRDYSSWFGEYLDEESKDASAAVFLSYAVHGFFDNGGQRLFVARVVGSGSTKAVASLGSLVIEAIGEGDWGNNVLLAVKPASKVDPNSKGQFRVQVAYYRDGIPDPFIDPTDQDQLQNPERISPDVFEAFDNLSANAEDANFATTIINAHSRLIAIRELTAMPAFSEFPSLQLQDGTTVDAGVEDYVGEAINDSEPTGLRALSNNPDISIIAAPDEVVIDELKQRVIDSCEATKDRFAIVSEQQNVSANNAHTPRDTSHAAFYYPWLCVPAPSLPAGHRLVPPHGHLAGIFARVDSERGVYKAPANEVVRGIDLNQPLEFTITKREQDLLNPRGVNVIRDFRTEGRGVLLFGARTMSTDSRWKYISMRRLIIFIEQSIDRGTNWVVFEPNTEKTWKAVRYAITDFLMTVWRDGALLGAKAEEAFFVKCDRTTMTQDDLDNGRLICLIGVAPVKPAEFVILRFAHRTSE